ncbi:F0F1 ATP synthase subunit epsilon [Magnetovibrio sp.]|uniref:F0F1 ATP synthase subunit epsilon n=1 Tax=Magnetovibrio sp. TaxID=2024836 RepID=UPI002F91EA63
MTDRVEFELVSPERLVKSQSVSMVVVPCSEGDIGVLPGHTPLIGTVRPGVVDIHEDGKVSESIFVSGGFVEVTPERCTLLAEEAKAVGDLKQDEAQARLESAKKALEKASSEIDKSNAEAEIKTAEAMLAALGVAPTAH